MNAISVSLLCTGLIFPVVFRWMQRRAGWRTHPATRPEGTVVLAACVAPWIGLAARAGGFGAEAGPSWLVMAGIVVAGGAWVESVLLLWRPFSGGAAPAESKVPLTEAESRYAKVEDPEDEELGGHASTEVLTPESRRLLERIHSLPAVRVEEIMTRREDVVFAESGDPLREVLETMQAKGHTRLVVTEGSLDRILGIVHAKDLTRAALRGAVDRPVRNHLRRWLRVPNGRSVSRVLEDFRRNRLHIGVVSDVRGRTLGLVTLTDVIDYVSRFDGSADR